MVPKEAANKDFQEPSTSIPQKSKDQRTHSNKVQAPRHRSIMGDGAGGGRVRRVRDWGVGGVGTASENHHRREERGGTS